ncbi:hypothetical protein psyc5s11_02640 [Clostridium gelidum]|uniref:N-acetyltransferase n=1 Tax=Clostridium gelidum TaxID=704125 RepID=A0ABM7T040_9CLOT|nr:hypothetical protein psyc5s11_02640 [Clostridium gelidum]
MESRKKKAYPKVIQEKMFEYEECDHDFYVTNMDINSHEAVNFYKKRGTCEKKGYNLHVT